MCKIREMMLAKAPDKRVTYWHMMSSHYFIIDDTDIGLEKVCFISIYNSVTTFFFTIWYNRAVRW